MDKAHIRFLLLYWVVHWRSGHKRAAWHEDFYCLVQHTQAHRCNAVPLIIGNFFLSYYNRKLQVLFSENWNYKQSVGKRNLFSCFSLLLCQQNRVPKQLLAGTWLNNRKMWLRDILIRYRSHGENAGESAKGIFVWIINILIGFFFLHSKYFVSRNAFLMELVWDGIKAHLKSMYTLFNLNTFSIAYPGAHD